MTKNQTTNLYVLWDELNQSDDLRQQQDLQVRLEQRAQQYAIPQRQEATYDDDDVYHVLAFQLGQERYGIDVSRVRGVRPVGQLTRVPGVPTFYRGVINVRGRIVSVLDLRVFFNIGGTTANLPSELVLVEASKLYLALLAAHIEEVLAIPRETVEPVEMKYARGVTAERLVILDVDTLFADERLFIGGKTG